MTIKYQDKNLIVTYIQVFLREYFGVTLKKIIPKSRMYSDSWEITSSDPLKVTGYWNSQSYSALALYMAYNFPNEGFPYLWKQEYIVDESEVGVKWVHYDSFNSNDPEDIIFHTPLTSDELIKIISSNIDNHYTNRDTIQVPERVVSYMLNEVVTPKSTSEEIVRVKDLIYPGYSDNLRKQLSPLDYSESLCVKVKSIQQDFIDNHKILSTGEVVLPHPYEDFKVTGYVDPWTERIINGGD